MSRRRSTWEGVEAGVEDADGLDQLLLEEVRARIGEEGDLFGRMLKSG